MQRPAEADDQPRGTPAGAEGTSSPHTQGNQAPAQPVNHQLPSAADEQPPAPSNHTAQEHSHHEQQQTTPADHAAEPAAPQQPPAPAQPAEPASTPVAENPPPGQPAPPALSPPPARPAVHYDGAYYEPTHLGSPRTQVSPPSHSWTVPGDWSQAHPPAARPIARRRGWKLPVALFLLTCLSTFWAGAAGEYVLAIFGGLPTIARVLAVHWQDGLIYMVTVLAILLAHEMGHFLLTLRYGIAASYPLFIPMPLTPIGTMGAVIAMQGSQADRKQLFDIGIAGPVAGLVVAIPVVVIGVMQAPAKLAPTVVTYHNPLGMELLIAWLRPGIGPYGVQMTPLLMAGWVGFLVTGLNMLPVSQLDGGHVAYALLGRRAHVVAKLLVATAAVYVVVTGNYGWVVMLLLVLLIGVSHPPTRNDAVPLGRARQVLGYASLVIPVLCFPLRVITVDETLIQFGMLSR